MRLRKCTCGGTAKMFGLEEEELRHVYCTKCGEETISYWDGRRAQMNWNCLMREALAEKEKDNAQKDKEV